MKVMTALLETASKKPSLSHTCAGHDRTLGGCPLFDTDSWRAPSL